MEHLSSPEKMPQAAYRSRPCSRWPAPTPVSTVGFVCMGSADSASMLQCACAAAAGYDGYLLGDGVW